MPTTRRTSNRRKREERLSPDEMGALLYSLKFGFNALGIIQGAPLGWITTPEGREAAKRYWRRPDVQRAAKAEGGEFWAAREFGHARSASDGG